MSDEHPLELEPPKDERDPPAVIRRRRRLSGGGDDEARPPRRRHRERAPPDAGDVTECGWPHRLGPLFVSTTSFYVLGFLTVVGLLLLLHNPVFGVAASAWTHEVLGLGQAPFEWNVVTTSAITLVAALLGYLIALLTPTGRWRAGIVLALTVPSLGAFVARGGEDLAAYVLPVALALTVGALMPRTGEADRSLRRALLLVGVGLLAAYLFMPWGGDDVATPRGLDRGYHGTADATWQVLLHADADPRLVSERYGPVSGGSGFFPLLLVKLPVAVAALVLLFGLGALVGMRWGWMRWAAGFLLLGLFVATVVSLYAEGVDQGGSAALSAWQHGAGHLGDFAVYSLAYALPLAGAVAEWVRRPRG